MKTEKVGCLGLFTIIFFMLDQTAIAQIKVDTFRSMQAAFTLAQRIVLYVLVVLLPSPVLGGSGILNNDGTMELSVNFRFPPGDELLRQTRSAITRASRVFCDATDGQVVINRVTFVSGSAVDQTSDVWVTLEEGRSTGGLVLNFDNAGTLIDAMPGLGILGQHIEWKRNNITAATFAHELGHYVFALGEQYDEQNAELVDGVFGAGCGIGPGFELGTTTDNLVMDAANNSIMMGGFFACGDDISQPCSLDEDCNAGVRCLEFGKVISAESPSGQSIANGYSEFSHPSNHDRRQGTGTSCPSVCTPTPNFNCSASWNDDTERFEMTSQTAVHGESDWETINRLYPGISIPAGGPDPDPGSCATISPVFVENLNALARVALILDASGSMGSSVSNEDEICENGLDDDGDGDIDEEADCAQSRIDFLKAAARAFIAFHIGSDVELGVVSFNDTASVRAPMTSLSDGSTAGLIVATQAVGTSGDTAIGSAIATARDLLDDGQGTNKIALLISDGQSNVGLDPLTQAINFKSILSSGGGIADIYTVPVSSSADEQLLANISADPAKMIKATTAFDIPAVLVELGASYRNHGLILPRTPGSVTPGNSPATFTLSVEEGATRLNVFIASRQEQIASTALDLILDSPTGAQREEKFGCQNIDDPYYCTFQIDMPEAGDWQLRILTTAPQQQNFTVLAYLENNEPRCFLDFSPRVQTLDEPTRIIGSVKYNTALEEDVILEGKVKRPDGSVVTFTIPQAAGFTGAALAFDDYVGRGIYETELTCRVGSQALPARGESIFNGPERPDIDVIPFSRTVTGSFYLAAGPFPICQTNDCDNDGLPNSLDRCDRDTDDDGLPDCRDIDADNDEVLDRFDGREDEDGDGKPNFLDIDSNNDGINDNGQPIKKTNY